MEEQDIVKEETVCQVMTEKIVHQEAIQFLADWYRYSREI